MDERKKIELVLNIRKTFTTQLENKELFVETAPQYFDTQSVIEDLFSTNWYDVPLQILIKHRIHFWALNPYGFRFYVPAMLTAIIKNRYQVDTLSEFVLSSLTPAPDLSTNSIFIERSRQFSKDEAKIIVQFLDSYFDLFPPDQWSYTAKDVRDLNNAIQFWSSRIA